MNKLLLLLPLLLTIGMHAENPPAVDPSMLDMNMLNMESTNDDLIMQAYDIRRDLLEQPEANEKTLRQIDTILEDLSNQDNPEVLEAYRHHLRRWKKLARISVKKPFDRKQHIILSELIIQREAIVKKIIECYIKMAFAQRTVADLATVLRREPTLAEKEQYQKELDAINHECVEKIKTYQQKLVPFEEQLLGDNRSFLEKYGTLIQVGIIGTVVLTGLIWTTNGIGRWWEARKEAKKK